MDRSRILVLRDLLAGTGWVERTVHFARCLRRARHDVGGLLLVGTPEEEPWHLAAHLSDEARLAGVPQLRPSLVRWSPPPGAPAHLAIGLERLETAGRRDTVFVVAPTKAPDPLLERVLDARKAGATILAVNDGDPELESLAHEALAVPPSEAAVPEGGVSGVTVPGGTMADVRMAGVTGAGGTSSGGLLIPDFETVCHLVSTAAGEEAAAGRFASWRSRLSRMWDSLADREQEPSVE
ncbi:MAG: hypothetical protein IRZ02_04980 [Acidothermus sp.]|nr:hypothetical protein [Acidothermus sp.]